MGYLVYDTAEYEIDDRPLAHLKLAVCPKLRLQQSFLLSWNSPDGGCVSVWMSSAIPLIFRFSGSHGSAINDVWLRALARSAGSAGGMILMNEADAASYLRGRGA